MEMLDERTEPTPSWEDFFARVGSEEWLTAKALLEVDPHRVVLRDAAGWLRYAGQAGYRADTSGVQPEPALDWEAWVADVDARGRGWSSTEWRLFDVVAGLTTGRPFNIVGSLDRMGSWEPEVWRILTEWGTGGNNREYPGRATALPRGAGRTSAAGR